MSQLFDRTHPAFVAAPGGRVIVGYDGSPASVAALEWGTAEAIARSSSLRIMTCSVPDTAVDFTESGHARRSGLQSVADGIRSRHPQLSVATIATVADPRDALVEDVDPSDLLIVGTSTGGAVRRLLEGSVPRSAARRSPCPVVVVHTEHIRNAGDSLERIVVGVDGSKAAETAIEWACTESRFHGSDLEIIHGWTSGSAEEAERIVAEAVTRCRSLTPNPVVGRIVAGPAIGALVAASRDADLVAIGSRGRSGFATRLFGSVALAVAGLADCPVAITHPGLNRRDIAANDNTADNTANNTDADSNDADNNTDADDTDVDNERTLP